MLTKERGRPGLAALLLLSAYGVLLALAPVLGSLASVIPIVVLLLLTPLAFRDGGLPLVLYQAPELAIFFASFAALTVAFAITADQLGDLRYVANFLALPLAAVAGYLLRFRLFPPASTFLFWLCLIGAINGGLIGVFDLAVRGLPRAEGFFGGSNLMPRVAIILGFAALGGVFVYRGNIRFIFYVGPIAALIATYASGSRGAALAIPVLSILAGVFLAVRSDTRRHLLAVLALAAAAVATLMVVVNSAELLSRFAGIPAAVGQLLGTGSSADLSTSLRAEMLGIALRAFRESPWVGHGWADFSAVAYPLLGDVFGGGPNDPHFQFHNDLANFAVAAGGVGVAAWLGILLAPTIGALTSPRDDLFRVRLYLALMLGLGYAVFGLTDFTVGYDLPTTLFALVAAAASSLSRG